MSNAKHHRFTIIALLIAVLAGFALGKWLDGPLPYFSDHHTEDDQHAHDEHEHAEEGDHDHADEEGVVSLTSRQIEASGISIVAIGRGGGHETRLTGRVTSTEDAKTTIAAPVSGRIVQVHVASGTPVEAGQTLAMLVSGEAAALRAQSDSAIAEAQAARLTYQRDQNLVEQGVVARQELEASRARSLAADAAARAAQAQLAAIGSPDTQGHIAITSPMTGTVGMIRVTPSGLVTAGSIVAEVSDPTRTEVIFTAPPAVASQLAAGTRMRVTVPTGSLEAVIVGIAFGVSEHNGSALVRAQPVSGTLPAVGAPVAGSIVTNRQDDGLTVPTDAVQTVDGQAVVFVFSNEGFRATPVLTGRRAGGQIEILKGLSGQERIAGTNAFLLKAELAKGEAEHAH